MSISILSVPPSQEECRNLRALLADALLEETASQYGRLRRNPLGVHLTFHGYQVVVQPCGRRQVVFSVSGEGGILEQGVLTWTRKGSGALRFMDGNSVGGFGDA